MECDYVVTLVDYSFDRLESLVEPRGGPRPLRLIRALVTDTPAAKSQEPCKPADCVEREGVGLSRPI